MAVDREYKDFVLRGKLLDVKVKDGNVYIGKDGGPMKGARASVETAGEVEARFTATRILLLGVFALAFKKKKDNRDMWLTIEGEDFIIGTPVKDDKKARLWANRFNQYAKGGES